MADEVVAIGDNASEITVMGRTTKEVRPILVPSGVTQGTFYRVVGAFDAAFRMYGTTPTVRTVQDLLPKMDKETIHRVIVSESFHEAMELRGVGFVAEQGLSPQQSAVLNLLEDFSDSRKLTAKLKAAGVTRTQYNGWLKDPLFKMFYERRIEDHLKDAHLMALSTIMTNAESGDQRAAEKVLEIGGRYNPQSIELQHARVVVQTLIESIQRHVTDETIVKAIIADVDMAQQMAKITQ